MTLIYAVFGGTLAALLLAHIAAHLIGWYEDPAPGPYVSTGVASVPIVEPVVERPMWPEPAPDLHPLTRPLTAREVNRTPALLWAEVVGSRDVRMVLA